MSQFAIVILHAILWAVGILLAVGICCSAAVVVAFERWYRANYSQQGKQERVHLVRP